MKFTLPTFYALVVLLFVSGCSDSPESPTPSTQPPITISATFVVDYVKGEFDHLSGEEITLNISFDDVEKIEAIDEPIMLVSWYGEDGFEVSCKGDRELSKSITDWFKNGRLRLWATSESDFQAHLDATSGGMDYRIKMFAQYSLSSDEEGNPQIENFTDAPGNANLVRQTAGYKNSTLDLISGTGRISFRGARELNND